MGLIELFLIGVGLSMDAFAVSICKGLSVQRLRLSHMLLAGLYFGFFQALMPMIGWVCVSLVVEQFSQFAVWVPIIALVLLAIVGGKMLYDGITNKEDDQHTHRKLTFGVLMVQAVATSIDALSTGFSLVEIAGNDVWSALLSAGIIAVVTFGICVASVYVGKKFGTKLGNKAQIVGGVILIAIGLEIFIKGLLTL